ncbi:MAG: pyridoxal phosphate-dependent aminotransferase [Spirochaetaceae bacterium]|nr:MAG: pyridoxal phosphate-dependent aminotransferase [Spirochaetaceae bacterium]
MTRINPEVAAIPYGDRKRIKSVAEARADLVDLMSGNPDMEMPPYIRERLKERIDSGPMRYTAYWGSPKLRQRLAEKLEAECGIEADPEEELLITHGVQEALYALMRTVLCRGDEVLIPSPHYANYLLDAIACGAEPVFVPLYEQEGFVPRIEELERAITPKTRLLVFSNPNNPLGVTWPDETIESLANLVRSRDLLVAVDEIYRDFSESKPPLSIASLPGMKERTFTLQGFSKSYFMMGLRVGYVAGPKELIHHVKQLHYILLLCPSTIGEAAALAALDCPREQIEPLRQEFRDKLRMLYEAVMSIPGITCARPNGTFYLFPNMRCFGMTSMDLTLKLIEETGVATLPGTEFGATGEGYLRLSVISKREQVEEGIRRLKEFSARHLGAGGGV